MKLSKRIESIVSLTVEDFYNSGKSTNESKKSLISWVSDALLQDEGIEDLYTYQISILILDKLKSLDIVDIGFIMELMASNFTLMDNEFSFSDFDEVVL
ncbi:hypothetical protein [Sulfurimonas xiamenensis]|uniref:MafI family immunity protein n=1 Tax=Sulfurimonas xiamenensis TaxID=2590021 RepID=A0AAJ4A4I9_9BACT|nr:hypothetical protein [Sulfurimonas xiamenensis]QFR43774.1 hypothetical protein FJR47_07565 [Sulfurimonas xiamenensis]